MLSLRDRVEAVLWAAEVNCWKDGLWSKSDDEWHRGCKLESLLQGLRPYSARVRACSSGMLVVC